jgi:sporulation protein YlmC with PRC-barrel domain
MKVSELLGIKVLDKNAMEVGKVSDVDLMPKEGIISAITVSTGEMWLRNKTFEIKPSDIDQTGDYLILNLEESEIEGIVEEKEEKEEKVSEKTRLTLKKED